MRRHAHPSPVATLQVYIASRDAKVLEETAARLNEMGPGSCHAIPADLSNYDDIVRLAKELEAKEEGEWPLNVVLFFAISHLPPRSVFPHQSSTFL
jgi:NAD(P)-dependent dehydrogenase (short-subunit alcohol dehydrogenase family)